ncbi:CDP-glucose 4,6-dehydratase [Paenibacillus cellulosilyticus]|uniref:CDP-glucose 4,6-dehydratase n=1 Tax=Paenibacillus cellulosilyticus TaxID=375489 RepID=A0A2V2YX92_9BACL|nr:CDP-glucose 4,6-dehydratase [Paenibacillus cellulosilyticus]PWW06263.1 CDP-glucose 4,6-dehydratase [Paenibacillus cellulosilyticus]QKS42985.1 CDP-glucose 4,6-dehydratase [Paenibacillus cellulosilyticus]
MSGEQLFWQGKRVFITGHTGFKGTWLNLWLRMLGAEVVGYSDEMPSAPAMYRLCGFEHDIPWVRGDIRDGGRLQQALRDAKPDIVFHLAAQPLVRRSYAEPAETFAINVSGTANVLDSVKEQSSVRAAVIITSDKCYAGTASATGFIESDPLGGADPYSSSKACAELAVDAYRRSYFSDGSGGASIATARAGNVIGGGDFAEDRIVPDIVRSVQTGHPIKLRRPDAIRPWQHVLEPLSGYMQLAEKLYANGSSYAEAWNFGPSVNQEMTVRELASSMAAKLGAPPLIIPDADAPPEGPYEAAVLRLDSTKARMRLNWKPVWSTAEAIDYTAAWYERWFKGAPMRELAMRQIRAYETAAAVCNPAAESGD